MLSKETAQHADYTSGECMLPKECTQIAELTHTCCFGPREDRRPQGNFRGTGWQQITAASTMNMPGPAFAMHARRAFGNSERTVPA